MISEKAECDLQGLRYNLQRNQIPECIFRHILRQRAKKED